MFYGGKTPLASVCIMPQHMECQHQFLFTEKPASIKTAPRNIYQRFYRRSPQPLCKYGNQHPQPTIGISTSQRLKYRIPPFSCGSTNESRNTASASNGSKRWRFPRNARQRAGNRRPEGLLYDRRVFPPHDCTVGIGGQNRLGIETLSLVFNPATIPLDQYPFRRNYGRLPA